MKVRLIQTRGIAFTALTESKNWIVMDGPEDFGGFGAGPRPMEVMLSAIGACTSADVASILAKKRAPVDQIQVLVSAKRAEQHPKVFTHIRIEYLIAGKGVKPKDVERAIELSATKYCPAQAMLKNSVEFDLSYKIFESKKELEDYISSINF